MWACFSAVAAMENNENEENIVSVIDLKGIRCTYSRLCKNPTQFYSDRFHVDKQIAMSTGYIFWIFLVYLFPLVQFNCCFRLLLWCLRCWRRILLFFLCSGFSGASCWCLCFLFRIFHWQNDAWSVGFFSRWSPQFCRNQIDEKKQYPNLFICQIDLLSTQIFAIIYPWLLVSSRLSFWF